MLLLKMRIYKTPEDIKELTAKLAEEKRPAISIDGALFASLLPDSIIDPKYKAIRKDFVNDVGGFFITAQMDDNKLYFAFYSPQKPYPVVVEIEEPGTIKILKKEMAFGRVE